jgi:hypothetical protein
MKSRATLFSVSAALLCAAALLAPAPARADKWILPREVKHTTNTFGDLRLVLTSDSTTNQHYPKNHVTILSGDKVRAENVEASYDKVFADPAHRHFLGIANRGLMKDAWVLFDRDGRIIRRQPHGAAVKYCRMSVTLIRVWCDEKDPAPEFTVENGALRQVTIRDCDGRRITLFTAEKSGAGNPRADSSSK